MVAGRNNLSTRRPPARRIAHGKFGGQMPGAMRHADPGQQRRRLACPLAGWQRAREHRNPHVLQSRQGGQQMERLEDESEATKLLYGHGLEAQWIAGGVRHATVAATANDTPAMVNSERASRRNKFLTRISAKRIFYVNSGLQAAANRLAPKAQSRSRCRRSP